MKKPSQTGFSIVEALLIVVILGILGFTGYFVWHAKQNADKSLNNAAATSQSKTTASTSHTSSDISTLTYSSDQTYYDCVDARGTLSDNDSACQTNDKTYDAPTTYSDDMIRRFPGTRFTVKLSQGAIDQLVSIAKDNFANCASTLPGTETIIFNASDDFLYLGVGCDSGHREIWANTTTGWIKVSSSQMDVSCSTVDKYKIPGSFLKVGEEVNECYSADTGSMRKLD